MTVADFPAMRVDQGFFNKKSGFNISEKLLIVLSTSVRPDVNIPDDDSLRVHWVYVQS